MITKEELQMKVEPKGMLAIATQAVVAKNALAILQELKCVLRILVAKHAFK